MEEITDFFTITSFYDDFISFFDITEKAFNSEEKTTNNHDDELLKFIDDTCDTSLYILVEGEQNTHSFDLHVEGEFIFEQNESVDENESVLQQDRVRDEGEHIFSE